MDVTIRAAATADIARMQWLEIDAGRRFLDVGLDAIAGDGPYPEALLAGHIADGTAWVAVDAAGEAIGYAFASVVDGEGHLDQVSVARAAMGGGVGTALIDAVCDWATSRGLDAVTLTTFRDVPFNGPYYERRGFLALAADELGPQLAGIRAQERANGIDVAERVAMRRRLGGAPPPGDAPPGPGPGSVEAPGR
jgi:GNAT superfamily N-acetyltransferase